MNPIKQPSDLPDNLPLLTQVADEDESNDLPTLTEVIADETTSHSTGLSAEKLLAGYPKDDSQVAGYGDQAGLIAEFQPDTHQHAPAPEAVGPVSRASDGKEMQQLLQHLESHIENVLTHKLNLNLEQMQRQAVEQAVNELKAELPGLLSNALSKHPEL